MSNRGVDRYHRSRDTLGSDTSTARQNRLRPRTFSSTAPTHFLPAFSVRRKVLKTKETIEFLGALRGELPRHYRVVSIGSLAMTAVEERAVVRTLRMSQINPEPEEMTAVAYNLRDSYRALLKSKPRALSVPLGGVFTFGGNDDKLGVVPRGWRGYKKHYATRGADGKILPIPILKNESDLAIGALANAFGDEESPNPIDIGPLQNKTPHVTLAQKVSGGPITNGEFHAVREVVEYLMPPEFILFDPAIFLRTEQGEAPETLYPRSIKHRDFGNLL